MCGIAGIVSGAPIGEADISRLARASEALRHRGPDDDGVWVSPSRSAVLAHRRLAIIDPTPEGHQPMVSGSGNALVFNGEIYNYRELAAAYHLRVPPSDTSVLLALLELRGISILSELRGFFTFAWWNEAQHELIVARDWVGKKPLYYATRGNNFVFASELRALVASGLVPFHLSGEALASYLRFYSVPHPLSMVEGVTMLPPGSILRVSDGNSPRVERWYRLPKHDPIVISYDEAVHETRRILERSVRDRLVSDVPVGAFLSGGLDSNAIVGLAARVVSQPIETFAIGFASRSVESETHWAEIGASAYGTHHHEQNVSDTDVAALLPDFFRAMDSPTGDGLNGFLVAKTARHFSPDLKVVLSGVGGDEAFLGYNKYRWLARRARMLQFIWSLPKESRSTMSDLILGTRHSRRRSALKAALIPEHSRWLFQTKEISSLTNSPLPVVDAMDGVDGNSLLETLRSDIEHYLPDMLLRDLDGMTMSQSLEARAPLLDKELMEFTWQLPMALKSRGATKQLLADAVSDILPESLKKKPKTGFELPMREWLRAGALRPWLDLLVSDRLHLVSDGHLDKTAVRTVYRDFLLGRSHYLKPWSIIALESWYRNVQELAKDNSKSFEREPIATVA